MDLLQQRNLSQDVAFQKRCEAAAVTASINIVSEVLSDVQTISMGAVTSGTFTLTFLGQTTPAQQWNSSTLAIQNALNALTTIGAGNVECTGGPLPGTPVVANFTGTLVGGQPAITHTDTLTGGVATITHTTTGTWVANHTKRAALASKVVANPITYGQLFAAGAASQSAVQADFDPTTFAVTTSEATVKTDISNAVSAIYNAYI